MQALVAPYDHRRASEPAAAAAAHVPPRPMAQGEEIYFPVRIGDGDNGDNDDDAGNDVSLSLCHWFVYVSLSLSPSVMFPLCLCVLCLFRYLSLSLYLCPSLINDDDGALLVASHRFSSKLSHRPVSKPPPSRRPRL